jgi:hypothetical protein
MNRPLSQTQIDEINRRGPSGFGDFIARVLAGGLLHTQVWGGPGYGPAAPDNVSIHAPIVLTDQPTLKNTGLSAPDYARNVNITSDKASTGDVTVVGTDVEGGPISETVPDLGSGTKATVAAFATVSEIRWPAKDGAEVSAGFGPCLGIEIALARDTLLLATVDGVCETNRAEVAVDRGNISRNTIKPATPLAANKEVFAAFIDAPA